MVIDEDPERSALFAAALVAAGFDVVPLDDGRRGVEGVRLNEPLITIVTVGAVGFDAFEVLHSIRSISSTYLVFVSGDDEEDVVMGLRAGADLALGLTVSPREVRARVEAFLRRTDPQMLIDAAKRTAVPVPSLADLEAAVTSAADVPDDSERLWTADLARRPAVGGVL